MVDVIPGGPGKVDSTTPNVLWVILWFMTNVEETTGYLESLSGIMNSNLTACVNAVMMIRDDLEYCPVLGVEKLFNYLWP